MRQISSVSSQSAPQGPMSGCSPHTEGMLCGEYDESTNKIASWARQAAGRCGMWTRTDIKEGSLKFGTRLTWIVQVEKGRYADPSDVRS